jgi:hypothetical protein
MSAAVLGALLLYFSYVESATRGRPQGKRPRRADKTKQAAESPGLWLAASAVVFFLALLAKESAIIFPAAIFALALILQPSEAVPTATKKTEGAGYTTWVVQALRQTAPFLCVTLVHLLMRLNALHGKMGSLNQHLPWSYGRPFLARYSLVLRQGLFLAGPVSRPFADPTLAEAFSVGSVLLPAVGVACALRSSRAHCSGLGKKLSVISGHKTPCASHAPFCLGLSPSCCLFFSRSIQTHSTPETS